MRVQRFTMNEYVTLPPGYGGMGFPWPSDALVPAPPPPLFRGLAGFGGTWEDWCDVNYYTPENNTKCKECPERLPVFGNCLSGAPWTMLGKQRRGLPSQTDLERLGPAGGTEEPFPNVPPNTPATESWFEKNKMLVFAGGGVLVLGLLALKMRKGKGLFGLNGYKPRKRTARRSRR